MPGPFRIFIGGSELENFTEASVSRSKDDLTGTCSISLFMSYVPSSPVFTAGVTGADVIVYVGNDIAFSGKLDRRTGKGKRGKAGATETSGSQGSSKAVNIGPNEYSVRMECRGKTKVLVDSSHKHPTGQMNKPTNRDVVDKLLEGSEIQVEWLAKTIKLDKVRFRDGITIWDELQRVGNENAHFIYQTRDGKLRVTDDTGRTTGDPLILGQNILEFSTEQAEDKDRGEIQVKGQRTATNVWGKDALQDTYKIVSSSTSTNKAPVTLQHYGDATPEALERRANFEANKRTSDSKTITVEVFHIQPNGSPWDIGNMHYVEIPPEGIFDVFECTGLVYNVTAQDKLSTTLTLSPVPAGGVSGGGESAFEPFMSNDMEDLFSFGLSRKAELNIQTQPGQYPASWGSAQLSLINTAKSVFSIAQTVTTNFLDDTETLPLTLPVTLQVDIK